MLSYCCNMPKFKPVTHVIFDLDGTLIDSEKIYQSALEKTVESYGKIWKPECQRKIAGCVMHTTSKITAEYHGIECSNEEFCNKFSNLADQSLRNIDLMPGAERLVRHLHAHNIPMAIATSSREEHYKMKTEPHEELFSLFGHVVCGGTDPMVKNGKPAPDIFLVCASRFPGNPKPEQILVFEDSNNGMQGALAAGMQVVMIPEPSLPYDMWKNATLRIDSLNYMIPQLFRLPPFPPEDQTFPIEKIKGSKSPEEGSPENNKTPEKKDLDIKRNEENKEAHKTKEDKRPSDTLEKKDIDIKRNEENKEAHKTKEDKRPSDDLDINTKEITQKDKKSGVQINESENEYVHDESDVENEKDSSKSVNNNNGNHNDDSQPNDTNEVVAAQ